MNLQVKGDIGLVAIPFPPLVHTPILTRQGQQGSEYREKLKGTGRGGREQEGQGHPEREVTGRKI